MVKYLTGALAQWRIETIEGCARKLSGLGLHILDSIVVLKGEVFGLYGYSEEKGVQRVLTTWEVLRSEP